MSPWIEGDAVALAAEHNAGRAALDLVRALGIEGARIVCDDEWATAANDRTASLEYDGGDEQLYRIRILLPEPEVEPEPVDLAVDALRTILDIAGDELGVPDDEARQQIEDRATEALQRLWLARVEDVPS